MVERSKEVKRLDLVVAENFAMKAIIEALIATHPDAALLQEEIEGRTQVVLAKLESNGLATDEMVEGFQTAVKRLRSARKAGGR